MHKPDFYSACFAIIKDDKGKVLMQRRANTGFRDGLYQLPSGHIELNEQVLEAMQRELKEELSIKVDLKNMKVIHVVNSICPDRHYINFYVEVKEFSGELMILEPEKCSEIKFIDMESLREDKDHKYEYETYLSIKNGEYFSEKEIK